MLITASIALVVAILAQLLSILFGRTTITCANPGATPPDAELLQPRGATIRKRLLWVRNAALWLIVALMLWVFYGGS